MSSEDLLSHWSTVYQTRALDQVSWSQDDPALSLELMARAGLNPASRIIDVGSGASTLIDALLDQQVLHITALDLADAAFDKSRARLGARAEQVRWVVGDLLQTPLDATFDLWHDRAVFHFMTQAWQRQRYHAQLMAHLAPGGHVILATFALDGPERCSGLPVMRYDADGLMGELGPDFALMQARDEAHLTPWGATQCFTYVLARRRA